LNTSTALPRGLFIQKNYLASLCIFFAKFAVKKALC